jgi:hypothetical protein
MLVGSGKMTLTQAHEPWLDTVPADWPPSRIRNVAQLSDQELG